MTNNDVAKIVKYLNKETRLLAGRDIPHMLTTIYDKRVKDRTRDEYSTSNDIDNSGPCGTFVYSLITVSTGKSIFKPLVEKIFFKEKATRYVYMHWTLIISFSDFESNVKPGDILCFMRYLKDTEQYETVHYVLYIGSHCLNIFGNPLRHQVIGYNGSLKFKQTVKNHIELAEIYGVDWNRNNGLFRYDTHSNPVCEYYLFKYSPCMH